MKIKDAKNVYSAHLDTLRNRNHILTELLKDSEKHPESMQNFDRVEISRELSKVDAQYRTTQKVMDHILTTESMIYHCDTVKQQSEAAAEGAEEFGKMLTIYRRIASGGEVPPKDERRLMEFSHELYMAAKAAAMMKQDEGEKYDSLWKAEEEIEGETKSVGEIAEDTEIAVPSPEQAASTACIE
ncbi:MAG: hypothetical protein IJ955_10975 [Oscillospiraceae bacterium]|nr:hypothetical protein [Oscillospiraceae bacterium]